VNGNLTVTGGLEISGIVTTTGHLIPSIDNTYDLASSSYEWKDLYVDGTANIDTLALSTGTTVTDIDVTAANN